jgi:hypothetical protein
MMPNTSGDLAQAHREDLLREAEQQRLVAQVSKPEGTWHTLAVRWASFLRVRRFGMFTVRRSRASANALRLFD